MNLLTSAMNLSGISGLSLAAGLGSGLAGRRGAPLLNPVLWKRPVMSLTFLACLLVFLWIRFGPEGRGRRDRRVIDIGEGRGRRGHGFGSRRGQLDRAISAGCYDKDRILSGQVWRLLTVGFTHIEGWHIAVNLYSLYALSALEDLYGHLWFALILFGSVVGGSLLEFALSKTRYSVGLSGGLYGLMFSYALLVWTFGGDMKNLLITLAVNLAINFAPGIAWQAHIGGGLTGLALTGLMLRLHA